VIFATLVGRQENKRLGNEFRELNHFLVTHIYVVTDVTGVGFVGSLL
jgi:hypothetical protein